MIARFKFKTARGSPPDYFNIFGFVGAIGCVVSGQIRQPGEQRIQFFAGRAFLFFQCWQGVLQRGNFGFQRLCGRGIALAHGSADCFGCLIAARLRILHFGQQGAAIFIQRQNRFSNGCSAPADKGGVKGLRIFADIF